MGTRSATGKLSVTLSGTITNTVTSGQKSSAAFGGTLESLSYLSGVTENRFDREWETVGDTILAGNTKDLNLATMAGQDIGAGSGNDALGQAVDFQELVLLLIKQTAGPGRLEIQPTAPANPVSWLVAGFMTVANGAALRAGGMLLLHQPSTDGYPITAASADSIRLGANGGDVTYTMCVLARSDTEESSSSSSSKSSSTQSEASSSTLSASSSTNSSTQSLQSASSLSTSTQSSASATSVSTVSSTISSSPSSKTPSSASTESTHSSSCSTVSTASTLSTASSSTLSSSTLSSSSLSTLSSSTVSSSSSSSP